MADGWKDKMRQRVKEAAQGQFFKAVAHNTVRILPNKLGPEHAPSYEFLAHRDVGPDKRFVRCGKDYETRSGKCWLCDVVTPKLAASEKRSKQAIAEQIKPEEDCLVQIAVYDHDTSHWTGPIGWLLSIGGPKSIWSQVMGLLTSTRRNYEDPRKGYNINFTRTGEQLKTRYGTLEPDDEPSPTDPNVLKKLKPFEAILTAYSEAEQKAAWFGKDYEPDSEEEGKTAEDETPAEGEYAEGEGEAPAEEGEFADDADMAQASDEEPGEAVEGEEYAEEGEAAEAVEGEEYAEEGEAAEAVEGDDFVDPDEQADDDPAVDPDDVEAMPNEEDIEAALDAEEPEPPEAPAPPPRRVAAPPPARKSAPAPAPARRPAAPTPAPTKKAPAPPARPAAPAPAKKAAPAPAPAAKRAPAPPARPAAPAARPPARPAAPPARPAAPPARPAAPPARKVAPPPARKAALPPRSK